MYLAGAVQSCFYYVPDFHFLSLLSSFPSPFLHYHTLSVFTATLSKKNYYQNIMMNSLDPVQVRVTELQRIKFCHSYVLSIYPKMPYFSAFCQF